MAFAGWPAEAVEFFEGLESDNTRTYWNEHKATYEADVKAPMEALLGELAATYGNGRVFRPYRDVRFSKDKTPYKLNCAADLRAGYISFSADGLMVGSGLYMPDRDQLARFRSAIDDDESGNALVSIVATLHRDGYDVGTHEALKSNPRGYPPDHPRIDLLRYKGIVMSRTWPVGAWLGTPKAKARVVACLDAARPLTDWISRFVG